MFPAPLSERLDALIDDLIMEGGIESASLASILLAAKDSVKSDYHVSLSRRVWAANNDLRQHSHRYNEGYSPADESSDESRLEDRNRF